MSDNAKNDPDASPYVGDAFWLQQGAELVRNTNSTISRQAERLGLITAWFWTAYMAFLAMRFREPDRVDLLAAAPCALLIIAYLVSTIAAGPSTGSFDPRSPAEVLAAYNRSTRMRMRVLAAAHLIVASSACLVAWGVLR